jgi:hypothetical protein
VTATANPQRRVAGAAPAVFATVADGVRAQVVTRVLLPPHLSSSAHEGRSAGCPCKPLLEGLEPGESWPVVPRGTREACTQEEHDLQPLRVAHWRLAPRALRDQALNGHVMLVLTMCAFCGAVEVRDTSFHAPAGMGLGTLAPRRRSDVLGWYSGARPAGRVYT